MDNLAGASERTGFEIAVVGMSGRFPGAQNIDEFWENLKNGVESISFFSDGELEEAGVPAEQISSPAYVRALGVIRDIEYFDASFFGYTPREAELMNPQVRFFHECCWGALENAGYNPLSYDGLIGLYGGASSSFAWEGRALLSGKSEKMGRFGAMQLTDKDYIAARVSYKLNLRGPGSSLQTACSTSLAAIHMACRALLSGECDMVLAGGVTISTPRGYGYIYREGMIFSGDGHCRAFDAGSQGIVPGEGVGVVVLKSLEDAVDDGDYIYAVIKGSAVNNDGIRKVGFTAPSIEGQAEAIQAAMLMADFDPGTITYVETHGTGTQLGDPVEIEALKLAFDTPKTGFCGIGSVKSNIGHLDAAAGAAGFIKTVLALKHRHIPPSLHFNSPNPKIDFENSPFYVVNRLTAWNNNGRPLRAGVSSFGIGGTNAHVLLEEAPPGTRDTGSRQYQLLLLSARTPSDLERKTRHLVDHFRKNPGVCLADAAYTLQVGREAFAYRRMLVCHDMNEAVDYLSANDPEKVNTSMVKKDNRPVIFMFPGQGSQYVDMGLDLYRTEPVFREEMDRCFDILKPLMGHDMKEILYPVPGAVKAQQRKETAGEEGEIVTGSAKIDQTEITQPLIFIIEYALARLLIKWGIRPYAMIGHSIGEYAAAHLSGVFSLEDALKLVVLRGRLMQGLPPGGMLSVPLPEEQVEPLLNPDGRLAVAAVNSPAYCVVSGPDEAIGAFSRKIAGMGYDTRRLHTSHAFHSSMMDAILAEFARSAGNIALSKPEIPYISDVTGNWITVNQARDPEYWAKHIRSTVRFSDGIGELLKTKGAIFVEVGPGRMLSTFANRHPGKSPQQSVLNTLRHPNETLSDQYYFLSKVGRLWLYGVPIDWSGFYADETRYRIPLPTYPFDRQRYWIDDDLLTSTEINKLSTKNALSKKKEDVGEWFYIPSWKQLPLPKMAGEWESIVHLVFIDECGLGSRLVNALKDEGHEVVTVTGGTAFEKPGSYRYTINPSQPDDYKTLYHELLTLDKFPRHILHLWGVTDAVAGSGAGEYEKELMGGFYSLLYLVKNFGEGGEPGEHEESAVRGMQLTVVSNHIHGVIGDEVICPGKAPVLGPLTVIPQEFSNIRCRSIDIDFPGSGTTNEDKKLVCHLLAEARFDSPDTRIAYRKLQRWVRMYEPVKLEETREGSEQAVVFRKGGVYLVTGGLGKIGLILAGHLAARFSAKLILTGRSPFPPEEQWQEWLTTHGEEDPVSQKIRKLRVFKEAGAEVLVFSADVSNETHMRQVIAKIEERFGCIHGVIHAAGIVTREGFKPIMTLSPKECNLQFQSKIHALPVLEKALEGRKLDFCLLMSSISAILGGLSYTAYTAANVFMDAFVYRHNCISAVPWLSVNWDTWQTWEGEAPPGSIGKSLKQMSMTAGQGLEAFQRILSRVNGPRVVVSTGDLQTRINQWITFQSPRESKAAKPEKASARYARPDLPNPFAAPTNESEQSIADVWQDLLGINQVGIHDNFFDLGASSLDIIHANRKIRQVLKRNIPIDAMFEFTTIRALAEYLSRDRQADAASAVSTEKLDKAFDRMEKTYKQIGIRRKEDARNKP